LSSIPQPFFRPLLIGEDIDFLYRVIEKKYSVGVINQPIYFYRRSGQQATHFHFLSLLYGELARYSSYGRRIIKSELLTFPQYRSLDKQHLPNAFKPFLQSKKLSNQHKIFSQRFIIGQIYSFFKQPIVFLSHYRLLYAMNFLLWRYQFLTFLLAHLTTIPKHLVGWLYCRLTHKKFFVE
ncbi:MAG: hypothetical protein ACR2NY_06360, partial [Alphaproteobacteria bacterium]